MMLTDLPGQLPNFRSQTAALRRHEPEILRQLPELFRDVPELLRHVLHHSGTRRSSSAVCRSYSGTRRNCPDTRRNHSGTPKIFKNPCFCPVSPKIRAKTLPDGAAKCDDHSPAIYGWVIVRQIYESRAGRQNVVAVRKDLSSLTGLWMFANNESQR